MIIEFKEFISKREFNGTLGDLTDEIVKGFVSEEIGQSKLGEFYNIAGSVTLEEYGYFDFNIGIDMESNRGRVLEEETIRKFITERLLNRMIAQVRCENQLLDRAEYEKMKLNNDSTIKGTYTLIYS